ncbi:precorrin-6A synthase (deacetylating) [[Mycobacterium] crassicus]|uniref:Precorrin-6A synthase (Deacetylating) n=1 Tax=[Mycobacterium] crassicus TaxID=2872309 RepID=A0ABU5XC23_9MYCO|nr:precorrin-6A synthase (deacetylating) [Mycolicibacter sp. MYC098]MEB3019838.1 precorrin-6A synthase (deacetylating) [Mycolicibacter sp. MYC098]
MGMQVWILGVGMGPQHVTPEVVEALRSVDYVVASEKSSDDGLLALRRSIVDTYAASTPIVAVADPPRDRSSDLTGPGYARAVADWHAARAARYAEVLGARGGTAAFLVWGDPALYDSTIRIVEQVKALGVELDYNVLPGISAPQLLAARHRIVLHEVGRPVHITTGRRLGEAVAAGQDNIVAMLNPEGLDLADLADWTIWWGANLGAAGERLVSGRVADVVDEIAAGRRAAKADAGWVMDVLLVRRP